jgi:alkanesulfonate monooxygenase SsuD/methylene tetrahydromethanopterin reductase-like flavin-dependent oxidoreductase (luciferase family)
MKLGVFLATQSATWTDLLGIATRVDELGYDHVWVPDHIYAPFGDPHQPTFEAWTTLAAWAVATRRVRLGVLVAANTLRNPALVAKMAITLDHASGGRAILGLGAAWFELEHRAFGFDFGGSPGERLRWLDQAAGVARALIDGEEVTFRSPKYTFDAARLSPPPVQARLPLLIGGSGERRTLRTVALYADMWNASGTADTLRHKDEVLRAHCRAVGRDQAVIERTVRLRPVIRDDPNEARRVWHSQLAHSKVAPEREHWFFAGTPRQAADLFLEYARIGFHTVIAELLPPFDIESIERLAGEVRPLIEAAG